MKARLCPILSAQRPRGYQQCGVDDRVAVEDPTELAERVTRVALGDVAEGHVDHKKIELATNGAPDSIASRGGPIRTGWL